MALQLVKAKRARAYLKLGMSAPSGGGKTLSSLLLAYGLLKEAHPDWTEEEIWEHIAIIDTENGSGQLYVGAHVAGIDIGTYNTIILHPPFEADNYTEAIKLCEDAKIEVCIIDSTTHLWSGEGGLLEQQSNAAKRSGNSYTAWRDITPQHNRFVAAMLQTPMHIIATMRAKQEYVQEKDDKSGKSSVRKLGMEPEQRKGMEYEFTIFFEIDAEHVAKGAKDRTSMFDQRYFRITPETGKEIMKWLETGIDTPTEIVATSVEKANSAHGKDAVKKQIVELCKELGGKNNEVLMDILGKYHPSKNPNAIDDIKKLSDLYIELQDLKAQTIPQDTPTEVPTEVPAEEPA